MIEREHTRIAVGLLTVLATVILVLELMIHSPHLRHWIDRIRWEEADKDKWLFSDTGHFIDFDDRLLNEELVAADYSRGGVVFFGASNLMWALRTWDQPAKYQGVVRNYGHQGATHTTMDQMLRFLIEHDDLLKAGKEKTQVILGITYLNADPDSSEGVWARWTRHGLYEKKGEALYRSPMNPLVRWLTVERAKVTGFLYELAYIPYSIMRRTRVHNPEKYKKEHTLVMGPKWKEKIQKLVPEFAQTLDYLKQKQVNVAVVFLPLGSWEAELPFDAYYSREIEKVCKERDVKIYDFRKFLEDEELADDIHSNTKGTDKFHKAVMEISRPHLESIKVLDPAAKEEKAQ